MAQFIVQALHSDSLVTVFSFLAQAPAAAPAPGPGGGAASLMVPGLILIGIYFLIFAPQLKRQKEHKKLLESIKSGDEVVTSGGIFGVVTQVKSDRFIVEIAKNTRIELEKSHVQARASAPAEDTSVAKTT